MLKSSKRFSWVILLTLVIDAVGVVFGILAANEIGNISNNDFVRYLLMGISIVIAIVMAISTIVAFVAMRSGEVKSAILALGKHTKIQLLAPLTCLGLGIYGLVEPATRGGQINYAFMMILVISYVVVLFVSGFNTRGLKAFRKDKESYGYISITSFIIVGALIFFCIVAAIAMTKIQPLSGHQNVVGYLEAFAILFSVGDIVAFFCLGVMAQIVKKYAPKVTMADADASKLDEINEGIKNLNTNAPKAAKKEVDPTEEIRKYKKLLDDGIITKEEFDAKKKEILKL